MTTGASVLEDLVLCRVCVGARAPGRSAVARSLFAFGRSRASIPEWTAQVDSAIDALRGAGRIEGEALRPTDAGRARVRAIAGPEAASGAATWKAFTRLHLHKLVPELAGDAAGSKPALALVARELGVDEAVTTETQLADAWIAKSLGLGGRRVTLAAVRSALLAAPLGLRAGLSLPQMVRIRAAKASGAARGNKDEIVVALVARRLAGGDPEPAAKTLPASDGERPVPPDFEARVLAAARGPRARSFGPSKVFIGSVWSELRHDPVLSALGEAGFKRALVDAHRRGALTLSRADLVSAMDPADVAASEIADLNATYHFIHASRDVP